MYYARVVKCPELYPAIYPYVPTRQEARQPMLLTNEKPMNYRELLAGPSRGCGRGSGCGYNKRKPEMCVNSRRVALWFSAAQLGLSHGVIVYGYSTWSVSETRPLYHSTPRLVLPCRWFLPATFSTRPFNSTNLLVRFWRWTLSISGVTLAKVPPKLKIMSDIPKNY